jgi:hypothetical protein
MRWGLGGTCAPPYVRRVRICGTLSFLFHSAPDPSLFCDAPPRVRHLGSPFFLQSFFCPNDLFCVWFPFSVYTYVVLIIFLYCTPYELLF